MTAHHSLWAQGLVAECGVDVGDGRIQLLVYPRILGYGFDPLTVWYCHDESGRLAGVIRLRFDERVRRMLRYYLAYCVAGFGTGRIWIQQWTFERGT